MKLCNCTQLFPATIARSLKRLKRIPRNIQSVTEIEYDTAAGIALTLGAALIALYVILGHAAMENILYLAIGCAALIIAARGVITNDVR